MVLVVHQHVRRLQGSLKIKLWIFTNDYPDVAGREITYLQISVQHTLAVEVCHALGDLVDHLEQIHGVKRGQALEVRHK